MRLLIFTILFIFSIFIHPVVIMVFTALFAMRFALPFEIILLGLFLDSLIFIAPPNIFTLGFLGMFIFSEILKSIIERESYFGKGVIFAGEIFMFGIMYLLR